MYSEQQLVGVTLDNHIQIWDARSGKTSKLAHFPDMAKMNYLDLGENLLTVNYQNMIRQNLSKVSTLTKSKS